MVQLNELYDGDKYLTNTIIQELRNTRAPHPLHGVDYSDGVVLCGRNSCTPCRKYRRKKKGVEE